MSSIINSAVESVMDMIDGMNLYAPITRGALGSGDGICCEVAPSYTDRVFLSKESYIQITLALNAKHSNLQTVSDTLNNIIDTLTRMTEYTNGTGWKIVDITNGSIPRVIGREENNSWLMSCDLVIKIYRKDE